MRAVRLNNPRAERAKRLAIAAVKKEPSREAVEARADLAKFGEMVSGLSALDHHREWLKAIATGENSEALKGVAGSNLRIAAPRSSGKTTWAMIAIAWIIGNNPGIRIILTSYSDDIARIISVGIKQIIETTAFKNIFPHVMPSNRWADGEWFVNRRAAGVKSVYKDPTLVAISMQGSISSRRSDLVIIEDPIKSSQSIANPSVRAAMRLWWDEVLRPTIVRGGRAIAFCTRYRVDDIHGTTFTEEKNWQVIKQKAIVNDENGIEKSYCETMAPMDGENGLLQKRTDNPSAFASQMQNEPIAEETQIIKLSWIKYGIISPHFEVIVVGVDLAASEKESADYTAIAVTGRTPKHTYEVLDGKRGRWSINETAKEIFSFYLHWQEKCDRIFVAVEEKALQVAFIKEFKRLAIEQELLIDIQGDKHKGSKDQRLRGISGLYEAGLVTYNQTAALGQFTDELVRFGSCPNDDCADANEISLRNAYSARKKITGGSY